ncbi:MAG: MFS transporter [Gammaproteobacteria bacterium]
MVVLDVTIVNVALSPIAQSFDASLTQLQWIVDSYVLSFACTLLLAGNLTDRFGAKNIFVIGLSLFSIASWGCGYAHQANVLSVFRFVQGVGGSCIIPSSLTLIHQTYAQPHTRMKAIGYWGAVGGIAAACGPLLGSILIKYWSWPAVFLVNIPLGIITVTGVLRYLTRVQPSAKQNQSFDYLGLIVYSIAMGALATSLIEAGNRGWTSSVSMTGFGIFVLSVFLLLRVESRSPHPMLPLHFFKQRQFVVIMFAATIINVGFYGELFTLPLYFHQIRHYSIINTGLALLPLTSLVAIASSFSGHVSSRFGVERTIIIGLFITTGGFSSLWWLYHNNAQHYFLQILPLAAVGFGSAFTVPALIMSSMHNVLPEYTGLISAVFNTARQIGSLLGVAIFGSILASTHSLMLGFELCTLLAGLLFAGLCIFLMFENRTFKHLNSLQSNA